MGQAIWAGPDLGRGGPSHGLRERDRSRAGADPQISTKPQGIIISRLRLRSFVFLFAAQCIILVCILCQEQRNGVEVRISHLYDPMRSSSRPNRTSSSGTVC